MRASGRDPQSVHGLEHFLCFMIKKMIRIKRDYRWQVIQKIRKKYQTENKLTDRLRKNIVLDYITTL